VSGLLKWIGVGREPTIPGDNAATDIYEATAEIIVSYDTGRSDVMQPGERLECAAHDYPISVQAHSS